MNQRIAESSGEVEHWNCSTATANGSCNKREQIQRQLHEQQLTLIPGHEQASREMSCRDDDEQERGAREREQRRAAARCQGEEEQRAMQAEWTPRRQQVMLVVKPEDEQEANNSGASSKSSTSQANINSNNNNDDDDDQDSNSQNDRKTRRRRRGRRWQKGQEYQRHRQPNADETDELMPAAAAAAGIGAAQATIVAARPVTRRLDFTTKLDYSLHSSKFSSGSSGGSIKVNMVPNKYHSRVIALGALLLLILSCQLQLLQRQPIGQIMVAANQVNSSLTTATTTATSGGSSIGITTTTTTTTTTEGPAIKMPTTTSSIGRRLDDDDKGANDLLSAAPSAPLPPPPPPSPGPASSSFGPVPSISMPPVLSSMQRPDDYYYPPAVDEAIGGNASNTNHQRRQHKSKIPFETSRLATKDNASSNSVANNNEVDDDNDDSRSQVGTGPGSMLPVSNYSFEDSGAQQQQKQQSQLQHQHQHKYQLTKRAPVAAIIANNNRQQQQLQLQLQQQQQQQQYLLNKITDTDLLPFSDFVVQQPAFSDIMKTWPPTRRQSAQGGGGKPASASSGQAARHHHNRPHHGPHDRQQASTSKPPGMFDNWPWANQEGDGATVARNHLNEDFDDTIVTADESFEQDQLPEPPTYVNYLGDLGDFIYANLRQFYDSSTKSPFYSSANSNNNNNNRSTSGAGGAPLAQMQRFEAIEDLLDDYYYDQYENSQVLYYGPQLVREGDIFEIGCYLPNDQPAEWTKSGKSLFVGTSAATTTSANSNQDGPFGSSGAAATTTTGHSSASMISLINPLRAIKKSDFMGAKQNYSIKVYEAQLSDSGNYRCNRLSRKYHKLIIVPAKISTQQLYLIQQKLLSIVAPSQVSSQISLQHIRLATLAANMRPATGAAPTPGGSARQKATIQASGQSLDTSVSGWQRNRAQQQQQQQQRNSGGLLLGNKLNQVSSGHLIPGHLIVENQPLIVACNISDEFILRRLREQPHFQLAWYKNGKLMRNSQLPQPARPNQTGTGQNYYTTSSLSSSTSTASSRATAPSGGGASSASVRSPQQQLAATGSNQRVQFVGLNGRQMYISSANYADAGDYLCSWARLPTRAQDQEGDSDEDGGGGGATGSGDGSGDRYAPAPSSLQLNPTGSGGPVNVLAESSLHQLVAPVKLRPFKSSYQVREGNQLRLVCQVQRGYPAAQISWYVGNRLVDADFLREHANEYNILQLQARSDSLHQRGASTRSSPGLLSAAGSDGDASSGGSSSSSSSSGSSGDDQSNQSGGEQFEAQIVEINPIPSGRQQMQMTAQGRGQWIEYKKLDNDKYAIGTQDKQVKYLQMKLAQLTGTSQQQQQQQQQQQSSSSGDQQQPASVMVAPGISSAASTSLLQQASLSVLVINKLHRDRHTSRYACRATSRANTDEVTTVIRVKDSATTVVRPYGGAATLVPGQPLHFECGQTGQSDPQFVWYKQSLAPTDDSQPQPPVLLEPNADDTIEIHNERLTLLKPTYESIGDYICRALKEDRTLNENESGTIKLRAQPFIDDFGVDTSHTGKSATITEGERLVLTCHLRDDSVPVNITWLRSNTADDETLMVPLPEIDPSVQSVSPNQQLGSASNSNNPSDPLIPTYTSPSNVIVERVDKFTKRLIIESVGQEHRGYYACMVDNNVTERSRKTVFIRVKDKIIALWPFLGILAELFILFTIIYVWETQRAQKALQAGGRSEAPGATPVKTISQSTAIKRPASGPTNNFESVPLNR